LFHIRDVISPDRNGILFCLEKAPRLRSGDKQKRFSVEQEIAPEKASG